MTDNFLRIFPDQQELLDVYPEVNILKVNAHLHTPFSFSAFDDISQIFSLAVKENIKVTGINDFFVTDGYEAFCSEALKHNIFPLFNIEFIGLLKHEQQQNIRINDPNNPGRCYFSGKGLDYPFHVQEHHAGKLKKILDASQKQVKAMVEKANDWFSEVGADIRLDFDTIRASFARKLVRERHIAKAIRIAVFEKASQEQERFALLTKISGGKEIKSSLHNVPVLENEIRGNLLKAGGHAFVEEHEDAFIPVDDIIGIILDAGGIPCYPVLLDDKNGNYTEYEKDPEKLWHELKKRNIGCIELIPNRNDADHLQSFVEFFNKRDFVILFGTEHNTPELTPLTCNTRGNRPLNDYLNRISYEGACIVAAHQYLRAKSLEGFINAKGKPASSRKDAFIRLGNAVIHHMIESIH